MPKKKQKSWFKRILFIIGAVIAISMLEGWGVLGILIFILSLGAYKLYQKREAFDAGMSNIETMIWGKPLKRGYWHKGELKNTRVKLAFGKSNWFSWKQVGYLFMAALFMVGFIMIIRVII